MLNGGIFTPIDNNYERLMDLYSRLPLDDENERRNLIIQLKELAPGKTFYRPKNLSILAAALIDNYQADLNVLYFHKLAVDAKMRNLICAFVLKKRDILVVFEDCTIGDSTGIGVKELFLQFYSDNKQVLLHFIDCRLVGNPDLTMIFNNDRERSLVWLHFFENRLIMRQLSLAEIRLFYRVSLGIQTYVDVSVVSERLRSLQEIAAESYAPTEMTSAVASRGTVASLPSACDSIAGSASASIASAAAGPSEPPGMVAEPMSIVAEVQYEEPLSSCRCC